MDKKNLNVHFIGINGSGISGVACIAKNKGFNVSGCDLNKEGNYTNQLIANNINIQQGHSVDHLKNIDLVVLSPALLYKDKYKEILETKLAMETIKTIKWQQFLGEYIMKNQNVVAVAGTHGKTTTTTLTALMLEKANFDPTAFIGGEVKEWGQNYRVGNSDYFVCEADEYDSNFLFNLVSDASSTSALATFSASILSNSIALILKLIFFSSKLKSTTLAVISCPILSTSAGTLVCSNEI